MSNEITVKLKCGANELAQILEKKGFKIVKKFLLDDTYYVSKTIQTKEMSTRQILNNCILIRNITQYIPEEEKIVKITYKHKNIAPNGDIINQENISCNITKAEEGEKLLKAIGYEKLMNIIENDIVYGKNGFEIAIKDIKNGEKLIEIETVEENSELNTIEKLKQKLKEIQIPVDTNNFFVKKAEIELDKILHR